MDRIHKTVSVSDLKTNLHECLRAVMQGEQWTVTENGRPIATLGPATGHHHLTAEGVQRQGNGVVPPQFWKLSFPEDPKALVRIAVLEEREEGR